jgi:hypothetical protein
LKFGQYNLITAYELRGVPVWPNPAETAQIGGHLAGYRSSSRFELFAISAKSKGQQFLFHKPLLINTLQAMDSRYETI